MIRSTVVALLWLSALAAAEEGTREVGTGELLLSDAGGGRQPALLQNTDIDVRVNGPMARVSVTQQFKNPSDEFVEGVYVFPLPDDAAVHEMRMLIGQRRIQGEVQEKQEALRTYEKAREEGKRAGLVEQDRPNVFVTSVANIAPGETVEVEIHYSQVIERDGATFTLRVPLTITPRFESPDPEHHHALDRVPAPDGSWHAGRFPKSIAESAQATARMATATQHAALHARLNPGLPLEKLISPSHDIRTNRRDEQYDITLAEGRVPMDRDFVLTWQLEAGTESRAAFFTQTLADEHYGLLLMMPPSPSEQRRSMPKEQLLIMDVSGSMQGARVEQARQSLLHAFRRLSPEDRFNVLAFNNDYQTLFDQPVQASPENIRKARAMVTSIRAGGGTEMLPVLRAALDMKATEGYVRQILFVTDGAVSNERAVLNMVHHRLGQARFYPVGIGAAPNAFLMDRLAAFGRGLYTRIDDPGKVQIRMERLLDRIARPALTDVQVTLPDGVQGDFFPEKVPDLHLGEPVLITVKLNRMPQHVLVQGASPEPWSRRIELNGTEQHEGVAVLWARKHISALMSRLAQGEPEQTIRPQVLSTALKHQLVSRYTSFVAVDRTPARSREQALKREQISSRLPADMAVNQRHPYPSTSLNTGHNMMLALLMMLVGTLFGLMKRRFVRAAQ